MEKSRRTSAFAFWKGRALIFWGNWILKYHYNVNICNKYIENVKIALSLSLIETDKDLNIYFI